MKMTACKLLVVAAVLTALANSAAQAAAPALRETSISGGWSTNDRAVAARYNTPLDPARSSAALRDHRGEPVDGWSEVSSNLITFRPGAPLQGEHGPFEITFTAAALDQGAEEQPAVDTIAFDVDAFHPRPPQLQLPATSASVPDLPNWSPGYAYLSRVVVSDPTQPFQIQGTAREAGEQRVREWSGIAALELKIFSVDGKEVAGKRRKLPVDCTTGCPFEHAFTITVEDLEAGFWTARVASYDLAGNRSSDSESVSFVVAG